MTANQPKPLLPVVNKPIMEHVLRLLKRHGFTETASRSSSSPRSSATTSATARRSAWR